MSDCAKSLVQTVFPSVGQPTPKFAPICLNPKQLLTRFAALIVAQGATVGVVATVGAVMHGAIVVPVQDLLLE